MARGRKVKRGASKAEEETTETKAVEETVEMQTEEAATADEAADEENADGEAVDEEGAEDGGEDEGGEDDEEDEEEEGDEGEPEDEAEKVTNDTKLVSPEEGIKEPTGDKVDTEGGDSAPEETPGKGRKKKFKKDKKLTDEAAAKERKPVEFSGLIFMCNSETKKDCFKYRVFGLPEAKKNIVEQVKKGTRLFLFDIDKRILHGVYKASSEGGMNLVEEAFKTSERKFPAQVRFRIQKDCMPLDESHFKVAIRENYFRGNKFKCELSSEQVGKLIKLFRPLNSRGLPEPKQREGRRDFVPKGKGPRGPMGRSWNPGHPRYPGDRYDYAPPPSYPRDRGYGYAVAPEIFHAEEELLRQRHIRQSDPYVDMLQARRRYLDDVYAAETLAVKRPITDPYYMDLDVQRASAYRAYPESLHSLSAGLQYDPRL
ncbi:hypothetical protein KP509_15G041200 [Ceratopteris richardii]|uniref:DCD domain-containing protein n=1 Tax=Ceratopteris richardii TaxID=49495 RepID=A0A8T2T741_CERRI|nr:hypothetical protein KP509_15G041200 [Ceratopteris richardii]KAH7404757.1 hypothetical protein KP509_15G041200 [Ceratopteris richardii]KAH7404758.1 hypothetical protein KP509_15G041200 [Ceratopteris richardii]KAH7404759.1 hypothetical protein KP509_15G041200 [Ceratopteris richardii]